MIDRMTLGKVPAKHHTILRLDDGRGGAPHEGGRIAYEHCFTRQGFEDAYSILYHRHSPAREGPTKPSSLRWRLAEAMPERPLHRAHLRSAESPVGGTWMESRTPLLVNPDMELSVARPDRDAEYFSANSDGDELLFFFRGGATLETPFGVQEVSEYDYLWIPKACPYRLRFANRPPKDGGAHHIIVMEGKGNFHVPKQFRNPAGQLTFDAPYSHRDFGRPDRLVTVDGSEEGPWTIVVKRHGVLTERTLDTHPCDVVGWDGYVYPITFPILNYQPKTGKVHLPPTIHVTFGGRDAVVCSFVPRKVDYGKDAIPCPYPHSSVDCDEFLFYIEGHFTSRKGVGPGSISMHPAGMPHAPQPGAYESSIGSVAADELALMVDTFKPLSFTPYALEVEDPEYMASWSPDKFDAAERSAPARGDDSDTSIAK